MAPASAKGMAKSPFTTAVSGRANCPGSASGKITMKRPTPTTMGEAATAKYAPASKSRLRCRRARPGAVAPRATARDAAVAPMLAAHFDFEALPDLVAFLHVLREQLENFGIL